jgi:hypothetical protein
MSLGSAMNAYYFSSLENDSAFQNIGYSRIFLTRAA